MGNESNESNESNGISVYKIFIGVIEEMETIATKVNSFFEIPLPLISLIKPVEIEQRKRKQQLFYRELLKYRNIGVYSVYKYSIIL